MKIFIFLLFTSLCAAWTPAFADDAAPGKPGKAGSDSASPTPKVSGKPSETGGSSNTNINTEMIPGVAVPVPGPTGQTSRGVSGGATVPGLPGAVVLSPGQAAPGTTGMAPGIAPGGMGTGGGMGGGGVGSGGVGSGGGL